MHFHTKDLTGRNFHYLTVISFQGYKIRGDRRRRSLWECKCKCGKIIIVIGKMLTTKQRTSCGCQTKLRALKNLNYLNSFQKKDKHPSWNHNLSNQERILNQNRSVNPELREWRKEIYRRSFWKCICCESKKKINAHHILNWWKNYQLRYDLNNGVCLCERCHKSYHHQYGYYNNNFIQLIHFIKQQKSSNLGTK